MKSINILKDWSTDMKKLLLMVFMVFLVFSMNIYADSEQNEEIEFDEEGYSSLGTAILAAVENGDNSRVLELLEQGADPDIVSADNFPSTILALKGGVPLLSVLLDYGADINARTDYGETALTWAVYNNEYTDIALMLLDSGADTFGDSSDVLSAPYYAFSRNTSLELTNRLLSEIDDVNMKSVEGIPLFFYAFNNPNDEIVTTLLSAGGDPLALKDDGKGLLDHLKYLEEKNGIFDQKSLQEKEWFPAIAEILEIEPIIRNLSIYQIVMLESDGYTELGKALYSAIFNNDYSTVMNLLEKGADPNHINNDGDSSICMAIDGDVEIIEKLISSGADVNGLSPGGWYSPLYIAINGDYYEKVKVLLAAGADPLVETNIENSALFYAIESSENGDIINLLLSELKDPNVKNSKGTPLLFTALENSDYDHAVRDLLSAGADPYVISDDGSDVLDYIAENFDNPEEKAWYPVLEDIFGEQAFLEPEYEKNHDWLTELYKPDFKYYYTAGMSDDDNLIKAVGYAVTDAWNQAEETKDIIIAQLITEYVIDNNLTYTSESIKEAVSSVRDDAVLRKYNIVDSYLDGDTCHILISIPLKYLNPAVQNGIAILEK